MSKLTEDVRKALAAWRRQDEVIGEAEPRADKWLAALCDENEALGRRVENWRDWAEFVWLSGGKTINTDAELQARACAVHDALKAQHVKAVEAAFREGWLERGGETCNCSDCVAAAWLASTARQGLG